MQNIEKKVDEGAPRRQEGSQKRDTGNIKDLLEFTGKDSYTSSKSCNINECERQKMMKRPPFQSLPIPFQLQFHSPFSSILDQLLQSQLDPARLATLKIV